MSLENYEEKLTTGYYRVRRTWEDEQSQIGQYRLLASAVKKADENPGYYVFATNGIAIYPEGETETVSEGEPIVTDVEPTTTDEEIAAEWGESLNDEEVGEDTFSEECIAAQTEALGEDEYPNDGNETPILYARANTLLNVRAGNSLDADKVTVIKKGTIVEVLQVCDNGWYRIKCEAAECGYAYVSNAIGTYFNTGTSLYTVQPADSLWKIAEKTFNDGKKYTEIKAVNNLISNVIRVGMVLLIP
ncbi:MAG: LysM peptidoglycan-binding domain-containing protein [Clostridiales bacterium]|nr:LysM peptidoglycan-binding domain-containing protein [Clostridiales bacterium]